jgi:hypothetical protein
LRHRIDTNGKDPKENPNFRWRSLLKCVNRKEGWTQHMMENENLNLRLGIGIRALPNPWFEVTSHFKTWMENAQPVYARPQFETWKIYESRAQQNPNSGENRSESRSLDIWTWDVDADVSLGMSIWGPECLMEEEEESVFLSATLVEQNRVRRGRDLRENCARSSSKSVRFCARRVP